MKKLIKSAAVLTAVLVIAGSAQAVQITGHIGIGAFNAHAVIDQTANTVHFVDDDALAGNSIINQATGNFSPLLGQMATYKDFTYSPLSVANPLWATVTIGLASFDLLSITSVSETATGVTLSGSGMIHLAGFDDTFGNWSFSADATSPADFNWSSTTTGQAPDGGTTVMLLGAALSGLAIIRRKLA